VKPQFTRAVLTIILLVATYALSAEQLNVSAQDCTFPKVSIWSYILFDSWEPGATAHVFVDNRFNEIDRNQLIHGIQNWNLYSFIDCSDVTFFGFETMDFFRSSVGSDASGLHCMGSKRTVS